MNVLNMKHCRYVSIIIFSLLLYVSFQTRSLAAGGLVVTPTRIEFNARTRSEKVTLLNTGTDAATYRISFVRRHMDENGNLTEIKEGEKGMFSDELIRYSPRQVTLPPGQSQVIRLMLRKPRDLPKGEYRSHMLFQVLPSSEDNDLDKIEEENPDAIIIVLKPMIGISIPVIVRHGELDTTFSLEDAQYIPADKNDLKPKLAVSMLRSGSRSVYGNFVITYTPEGEDNSFVVSQVKGVAVYAQNAKRRFTLRLEHPPGVSFEKGTFNIVYAETGKKTKSLISSEIELKIP